PPRTPRLPYTTLFRSLAGRPGAADEFSIFQTHPRTADRVQRAVQQATGAQAPVPASATHDEYLARLDGMLYGDDPDEGFIRGQRSEEHTSELQSRENL